MANSQCIWAKTSWECVQTQEQRQTWEKYRNARQKQGSVESICTITLLAQVVCTLPGCLCVPAKSIHPSLLQRAKPAHRDRRQQHTRREVMPRGESGETGENYTSYAKRRRESYLLCLSNSSFPTFSCGGNGAFRALASATAFLDLAVKFSCVSLETKGKKGRNYREGLPVVGAALWVNVCGGRADTRRPEVLVARSHIRVQ